VKSNGKIKVTGGAGGDWEGFGSKSEWSGNVSVMGKMKFYTDTNNYQLFGFDDRAYDTGQVDGSALDHARIGYISGKKFHNKREGTGTLVDRSTSLSSLKRVEIKWVSSKVIYTVDQETETISTNVPADTCGVRLWVNGGSYYIEADWIAVRKYVDPEPSHGSWGAEETFTLTVETLTATQVTYSSAKLNAEITELTNQSATKRGFEWGIESGNYTDEWIEEGNFSTGTFNKVISGLSELTTYYFRAKAYGSISGWEYGSELSFTTSELILQGEKPKEPISLYFAHTIGKMVGQYFEPLTLTFHLGGAKAIIYETVIGETLTKPPAYHIQESYLVQAAMARQELLYSTLIKGQHAIPLSETLAFGRGKLYKGEQVDETFKIQMKLKTADEIRKEIVELLKLLKELEEL